MLADLLPRWSQLRGNALVAIHGIRYLNAKIHLSVSKPVGATEINIKVLPQTVLNGDLQGVKMSLPALPTRQLRRILARRCSLSVGQESGRTVLRFPKEDRDVNIAMEMLKVGALAKFRKVQMVSKQWQRQHH